MRTVLYLHNSSQISGGERSLLGLWSLLDRERYRPVAVLPSEGPLADEARKLGVMVVILLIPSWRPMAWPVLCQVRRVLIDLVRKEKVRVIHSYSPRNNIMVVWVARSCRVKVIWHERNIPVAGEADISRMFQGWPDALICNSQAVAARFVPSSKVRVIHNGVDASVFVMSRDKVDAKKDLGLMDRKVVGVTANLSPRKRLDVFLKVAAEVMRNEAGVFFLVVGGAYGPDSRGREALLRKQADDLGLTERIIWTGFQEDVRPYLTAMDVVCHPTDKEACSRSILEAMAVAKPVVAFADGGNPEIIEDGKSGILVYPCDIKAMAAAIGLLLNDPERRERLGMVARARVGLDFSLRMNAEQTMGLYQTLCI